MSRYQDPTLVAAPDLYAALYTFVATYALPVLDPDHILRGWQNRFHLPPRVNDFAVLSIIDRSQHGTNVRQYTPPAGSAAEGTLTEQTLREAMAQIDLCSDTDAAFSRAESLQTAVRGLTGAAFFDSYGIGSCYADSIRALDFTDGSKQYVRRATLTLHLTYWSGITVAMPFVDAVTPTLINANTLPSGV